MGGFITGICTTIILMQVPKLMGGTAGTGELSELAEHIWATLGQINLPSLIFRSGFSGHPSGDEKNPAQVSYGSSSDGSRCIIILFRPDFQLGNPYTGCSRTGAACMEYSDFSAIGLKEAVIYSLSIAVVIMAETLLGENSFAQKNGYRVNANQELVAFPWEIWQQL